MILNNKKWIIVSLLLLCSIFHGCSVIFPDKFGKKRVVRKLGKKVDGQYDSDKKEESGKRILMWPIDGEITSLFGQRDGKPHDGIDISAKKGTDILAAEYGQVIFSGWGPTGYGQMVIIKHSPKFVTVYAHNSKNIVSVDDKVKKGSVIAYVGDTGRASGPHLHFEIRKNLIPQNPLKYLPSRIVKK